MDRILQRTLALVFSIFVVTSSGILLVVAGDPLTGNSDESEEPSDRSVTIDPALQRATEPVQVLVRLEEADLPADGSRDEVIDALQSHADRTQEPLLDFAERFDGITVLNRFWLSNTVLVEVDPDRVPVTDLAAVPGVVRLQANERVYLLDVAASAPAAAPQIGLESGQADPVTYGLDQINAPDVWSEFGTTGEGVTVAVLDSGIDPSHPDIDLYTTDSADPTYPGGWAEFTPWGTQAVGSRPYDADTVSGHGTHVSATVAGGDASGTHIGVAPGVTLLHGSVINIPAASGLPQGTLAGIIGGMQWAVVQRADVVSMSLGVDAYIPEFIPEVRNAEAAGTLVVAAIGNSGAETSGSPGNVYDTLSVGAVDSTRQVGDFSAGEVIVTDAAWGPAAPSDWPDTYLVPDVTGPGVSVQSAAPGGGYRSLTGTSMAAPHVSGAAALAIAAAGDNPTPATVRAALVETASKPAGLPTEPDTRYGAGVIDALGTARALTAAPAPGDPYEPNDDFDSATPLPLGTVRSAALDPADVDVFVVQLSAGQTVTATFDRDVAHGVSVVAVYGPDRELVTHEYVGSGAPASMTVTADTSGGYFVQVVDVQASAGPYSLMVGTGELPPPTDPTPPADPNEPNDDPSQATPLPLGATVSGEIPDTTDSDWFRFETAGAPLQFDFQRTDGTGTLTLTFLDTQGSSISEPFAFAPGQGGSVTGALPAGTYFALVQPAASGGTGAYDLTYVDTSPAPSDPNEPNDDPSQATPLPRGGTFAGEVADATDQDWATFQAQGPVAFTLARPTAGTGTLTFTFLNAQGAPVADPFTVSPGQVVGVQGSLSGTFYVVVQSGSDGGVGPYAVEYAGDTDGLRLLDGTTVVSVNDTVSTDEDTTTTDTDSGTTPT